MSGDLAVLPSGLAPLPERATLITTNKGVEAWPEFLAGDEVNGARDLMQGNLFSPGGVARSDRRLGPEVPCRRDKHGTLRLQGNAVYYSFCRAKACGFRQCRGSYRLVDPGGPMIQYCRTPGLHVSIRSFIMDHSVDEGTSVSLGDKELIQAVGCQRGANSITSIMRVNTCAAGNYLEKEKSDTAGGTRSPNHLVRSSLQRIQSLK